MDQGKNLLELNEELIDLGFNTREFIDDIRKAIYERNVYKQVAYQDGAVRLNLNFGKDDYARFNFFDYSVHYPGAKEGEHFQAFEGEVPLSEAKKLVESRIESDLANPADAQTPLFLSDVRLEQQSLDQNRLNPPGVYGGINTIELDKRMQAVDWHQHPGYWTDPRDDPMDKQLTEMRRLEKELGVLESLRGNKEALNASEKLMLKYFTGTPAERMVVEDIRYLHASFEAHKKQINQVLLNNHVMNAQNLSYLQKQALNLGFGEGLNKEIEKQIKAKKTEFTIPATQEYNRQKVDYQLHYKAGDKDNMYFFNKYDAAVQGADIKQTFYINKGSGITAKEAYNLLEGRAVYKQLENQENQKYNAWVVLDKQNKNDNGNFKLHTYNEAWNYKPERAIDKMAIVGIDEPGARDKLLKSLEKGNRHQVTAMKDGKEVKLYIEANPAEHLVNLTNYKGEAQQLEHYKKPELKAGKAEEQKQAQGQEAAQGKKKSNKAGMKV